MSKECNDLHQLCASMKRYTYENRKEVPLNGVYVFFEEGEHAHGGDRIVRIGSHKTQDRLPGRLSMHFSQGIDMSGSSFRQDICRALLHKQYGPAGVEKWEAGEFDDVQETKIAAAVSDYIHGKMSFVIFEVTDSKARLGLEAKLIAAVSSCEDCKPSENWLGKNSPHAAIKESGLWQVDDVFKRLTEDDFSVLRNAARQK
ncbi:hypothetical protein FACS189491_04620 [Spirochaetia bacterium]|nr:hypothetical protein FACS189491_04620 [Spirochaetia bacterium]